MNLTISVEIIEYFSRISRESRPFSGYSRHVEPSCEKKRYTNINYVSPSVGERSGIAFAKRLALAGGVEFHAGLSRVPRLRLPH